MKKALLVTRVSGFVPQFEMNNVRLLQQMGYEVHYAANFDTVVYGDSNERLEGTGVICHHIPFCRSPFSARVSMCYRQLKELMTEEEFSLIHCHMPMTGVLTRMAAQAVRRRTGCEVPVLYTAHGFHFYTGAPLKNWIYYLPERWLARYTDCLITMNEEDYRRARSFPLRGKAEKIPGVGIEVSELTEGRANRDKASGDRVGGDKASARRSKREELGLRDTDFVLISVGELNANKNHIQILRVLAQNRELSVKYVLCGQGPAREELEEYVRSNRLADRVLFVGYRSDVGQLLLASDLFVFPSLREGLSVAVMEAMRAGLPVVAKNIRGNVDLIEDGKGGMLVGEGNVTEYLSAIQWMKGHPEQATQMGEWNRERIFGFSRERVEERMRGIYEGVSALK